MPIRQRLAVGIFRTPLVEPTAAMTLAGAYQRFGSPNSPSARAKTTRLALWPKLASATA